MTDAGRLAEIKHWVDSYDKGRGNKWNTTSIMLHELIDLITKRDAENQSLNFQLEDRIKTEWTHKEYINCEIDRCHWIQKCANQSRRIAKLESALCEIESFRHDYNIKEAPRLARDALKST